MPTFRINKNVSKNPLIWGLKLPLFGLFIGVVAIMATTLISGISIGKILTTLVIVPVVYIVLLILSRINFYRMFLSDEFPNQVKNNLNE